MYERLNAGIDGLEDDIYKYISHSWNKTDSSGSEKQSVTGNKKCYGALLKILRNEVTAIGLRFLDNIIFLICLMIVLFRIVHKN